MERPVEELSTSEVRPVVPNAAGAGVAAWPLTFQDAETSAGGNPSTALGIFGAAPAARSPIVPIKGFSAVEVQAVLLKAFGRIADAWSLTDQEAAALLDVSESTWRRARSPGFPDWLTDDQMLRISAILGLYEGLEIYFNPPLGRQWIKLPNRGREFNGQRPVDSMICGGLSEMVRVRDHIDALRGGV